MKDLVAQLLLSTLPRKRDKNVLHRRICPVCGKKNVNLYRQSKQWQCRVCCELEKKLYAKQEEGAEEND